MSGPVRSVLALIKTRMNALIIDATTQLQSAPAVDFGDATTAEVSRWLKKATAKMQALNNEVKRCEEQNARWAMVMASLDAESLPAEEAQYKAWAEGTGGFLALMENVKAKAEALNEKIVELTPDQLNITSTSRSDPQPQVMVKLPTMELTKFSGHRRDWLAFWSMFSSTVDTNATLPLNQKLSYLVKSTEGGLAHAYLAGLKITDANYSIGKQILLDHYGDDEEQALDLLSAVEELKPCRDFRDMITFRLELEKACLQLEDLKVTVDDRWLTNIIKKRATKAALRDLTAAKDRFEDRARRAVLGTTNVPDKWTAKEMRKELARWVEVEERMERDFKEARKGITSPSTSVSRSTRPGNRERQPAFNSAFAVKTPPQHDGTDMSSEDTESEDETERVVSAKFRSRVPKCFLCSEGHWMSVCPKFKTAEEKKAELRKLKRCTRCYSPQHQSKQCQTKLECTNCGSDRHRRPLCIKPQEKSAQVNAVVDERVPLDEEIEGPGKEDIEQRAKIAVANVNSAQAENPGDVVLLKCARVDLFNPGNCNRGGPHTVFFDDGATKSFITEEAARRLGVLEDPKGGGQWCDLPYESFGDTEVHRMKTQAVKVAVALANGETISIPLQTAGTVTSAMPAIYVTTEEAARLERGEATPLVVETKKPDVLIGSDLYHNAFKVRGKKTLKSGFTLVRSRVGCMVAGKGRPTKVPAETQANTIIVGAVLTRDRTVSSAPPVALSPQDPPSDDSSDDSDIGSDQSELVQLDDTGPAPDPADLTVDDMSFAPVNIPRQDKALEEEVRRYFSLESMGIIDDPQSDARQEAEEQVRESTRWTGKRYETGLPWARPRECPPMNLNLATKRIWTTHRTLVKTNTLKPYDTIIRDYEKTGKIQTVDPNEPVGDVEHYIPHFPVPKKNGDPRIVFGANAKLKATDKSLNDCLLQGPVVLCMLLGILLRFRLPAVVSIADLEQAFLNVEVAPRDRDALRFLWMRDISKGPVKSNLVVYRFTRVCFGLVCSPFLLGAVILFHLLRMRGAERATSTGGSQSSEQDGTSHTSVVGSTTSDSRSRELWLETLDNIRDNLYVDNVLIPANNVNEAKQKNHIAKDIFARAAMNLREFASNDPRAIDGFVEKDRLTGDVQKVLGIRWQTSSDELLLSTTCPPRLWQITKRRVLQQLASNYDPLGLLCPVMQKAKSFFQHVCRRPVTWDEPLLAEDHCCWNQITKEWEGEPIRLARRVNLSGPRSRAELHIFADASNQAFGVAAYLRCLWGEECCDCNLIFAKSRVKPSNFSDHLYTASGSRSNPIAFTPKMELLAIELATRIKTVLEGELRMDLTVTIWTDSTCAMDWIRGADANGGAFVRGRCRKIRAVPGIVIKCVATEDNPADLTTKGVSLEQLRHNQLWFNGPSWLRDGRPIISTRYASYEHGQPLVANNTSGQPLFQMPIKTRPPRDPLVDVDRFSRWTRLVNVVGYVLRFVHRVDTRKDTRPRPTPASDSCSATRDEANGCWEVLVKDSGKTYKVPALSSREISEAHDLLIKESQRLGPMPEALNLGLHVDDRGLYRCNGKIGRAPGGERINCPILLPKGSRVGRLIIYEIHRRHLHSGVRTTLSNLRKGYYMPGGRRAIYAAVEDMCYQCRPFHAQRYRRPDPPQLPKDRVTPAPPFDSTGVDYWGPVHLTPPSSYPTSGSRSAKKKATVKHYVALFTCFVTRAVHLELVSDATTVAFLRAFRRFIARRGVPHLMTSDNGSNLKLGGKVIRDMADWSRIYEDPTLLSYCSTRGIEWRYIVERAPWKGGAYERVVQMAKRALRAAVGRAFLRVEEFQTLMAEAEAVVNSRPLTYLSTSPDETLPIRPMDALLPMGARLAIAGSGEEGDTYHDASESRSAETATRLADMWHAANARLNRFWAQFLDDYLPMLMERHWTRQTGKETAPTVGEMVLLGDEEDIPRGQWPRGVIQALLPSSDGVIRAARVRLPTGLVVRRAIDRLYPLELDGVRENPSKDQDGTVSQEDEGKLTREGEKGDPIRSDSRSSPTHKYNLRSRGKPNLATIMSLLIGLAMLTGLTKADPSRIGQETSRWTPTLERQMAGLGFVGRPLGYVCFAPEHSHFHVPLSLNITALTDPEWFLPGSSKDPRVVAIFDGMRHNIMLRLEEMQVVQAHHIERRSVDASYYRERLPLDPFAETHVRRKRFIDPLAQVEAIAALSLSAYCYGEICTLQKEMALLKAQPGLLAELANETHYLATEMAYMEVATRVEFRLHRFLSQIDQMAQGKMPLGLLTEEGRKQVGERIALECLDTARNIEYIPRLLETLSDVDWETAPSTASFQYGLWIQRAPDCKLYVRDAKHRARRFRDWIGCISSSSKIAVDFEAVWGVKQGCAKRSVDIWVCGKEYLDGMRVEREEDCDRRAIEEVVAYASTPEPNTSTTAPTSDSRSAFTCRWEVERFEHHLPGLKNCQSRVEVDYIQGWHHVSTNCPAHLHLSRLPSSGDEPPKEIKQVKAGEWILPPGPLGRQFSLRLEEGDWMQIGEVVTRRPRRIATLPGAASWGGQSFTTPD